MYQQKPIVLSKLTCQHSDTALPSCSARPIAPSATEDSNWRSWAPKRQSPSIFYLSSLCKKKKESEGSVYVANKINYLLRKISIHNNYQSIINISSEIIQRDTFSFGEIVINYSLRECLLEEILSARSQPQLLVDLLIELATLVLQFSPACRYPRIRTLRSMKHDGISGALWRVVHGTFNRVMQELPQR